MPRWPVGPHGLLLDRQWALLGPDGGSPLTQKAVPTLATIHPCFDLPTGVRRAPTCYQVWEGPAGVRRAAEAREVWKGVCCVGCPGLGGKMQPAVQCLA